MNFTLDLTLRCNLACRYCFEADCAGGTMNEETAKAAVRLAYEGKDKRNGFSFFGGEPLLEFGLLKKIVACCDELCSDGGGAFDFKMTTNGLLLTDEVIDFLLEHRIETALSHDGLMQDDMRLFHDGKGSFAELKSNLDNALLRLPDMLIMLTVTPQTAEKLSESVIWLYEQGARRVLVTADSRPSANWTDEAFERLTEQFELIAEYYYSQLEKGVRIRFPRFDDKIAAHVQGSDLCQTCRLGKKQPIITPDGKIYPCTQFAGISRFELGDVFSGIDEERREAIYLKSLAPVETCTSCALRRRCRHSCACMNYHQTGSMHTVSPFQCCSEQMLIGIADRLAERLYKANNPIFMSRCYGERQQSGEVTFE